MRVDICRFRTCKCCVVRKPQLGQIDLNRCLLYGNRRLDPRTIILVNQGKHGYLQIRDDISRDELINEVVDIE